MRKKHSSQVGLVNSRIFFGVALCAAGTLLALLSLAAMTPSGPPHQGSVSGKITPWVLERTAHGVQAEFLVVLADQADLAGAAVLPTKEAKGHMVRDSLWTKAQTTQAPIVSLLAARKVEYRSYYIVNAIWVKGDRGLANELAARPDVLRLEGNPVIHNVIPQPSSEAPTQPQTPEAVESGITYTKAPQVWALGYTGQGIVIGGADTGIRWTHNALKPHYRGWNGTTADHNYNWHDSIHDSTGNVCGNDAVAPCDDNGHGTHTIGTAVGDDGGTNQIGMAPGAKFIGCRNMNAGDGTPARYLECMEFFLAPYPIGGTPAQGDSTKAPDVTTNSWTCPSSEGCSTNTLQAGVEAQRAAGIEMVAAAGNSGSNCSTISDPPSFYQAIYTIGALNTGADTIAAFSSRGPITADGSNRRKPDICAPGTNTRSAYRTSDTTYTSLSGTSMATPHIAGAVTLLLSAQPLLKHDTARIEQFLNDNAVHLNPPVGSLCDAVGTTWPNNVFGYGRVDIKAAVDKALILLQMTGAVSRKTHGGAGSFDITLPLSGTPGVECRSSGGNHTLVFTFTNNVVSGSASVTAGTGSVSGSPTFSGNTLTVNLTGVTDAQNITVSLNGVTDSFAQVLPSTPVTMSVLPGDTTADGTVNSADISQTKSQSGNTVDGSNFREDVTVDGTLNSADISLVKSKSGSALP